jgi:PAS domain S-box-containing protein
VAVAAGFGLRVGLTAWIGLGLPTYITFYPAVMVAALLAGFGPGLLATVLTGLTTAYWILPPEGFFIASPVDRVGLVLFAGMGLFMSTVSELYRLDRHKAAAYDREMALRETRREKEFLAGVLERASQPFAVGYPDGRVGLCNRAYEQLTGYSPEELRAIGWATALTPPEWRERERQKLEELHLSGQPVRYEKEYVRKDGTRVPVELLVHLVKDTEGKPDYYYSFLTDITERKQKESELHRLNRTLDALRHSSEAMMRAESEKGYLAQVCKIITEDCGHAMVWIGQAEEDEPKTVRPLAHAGFEEGYLETLHVTWADTERGRGPTGTAIRTGKPDGCRNMLTDPRFAPWREEAAKRGYASSVAFPLRAAGKSFGAITIYSRTPEAFSEDETKLLVELADDLAYGITALRLREAHTRAEQALRQSQERSREELERRVAERTAALSAANQALEAGMAQRQRAEKEHRELLRRLADAQESERARISRELHDQLGQDLTALKLGLRLVKNQGASIPAVSESTDKLEQLSGGLMQTIHRLAWELHPPVLDDLGLEAALRRYTGEWSENHHVPADFHATGMEAGRLPLDTETALYRVTQEALTNVLRHANAKRVGVLLERRKDLISLIVEDDGAGFDAAAVLQAAHSRGNLGLLGMQERVVMVGGTIEIESSPGAGTTVFVRVPLEAGNPAES